MISDLKDWFAGLSPRDQLMLLVLGGAVGLYILVFLVLMPMRNELERKEQRNLRALEEQHRVLNLAGQVLGSREDQAEDAPGQQSLNALLNNSLGEFGLSMETFQPSGSAARVRLAPSEFNRVIAWLDELENTHAIQIRDLTLTAEGRPGMVLVSLSLLRGD